jgi:hypothetical protein
VLRHCSWAGLTAHERLSPQRPVDGKLLDDDKVRVRAKRVTQDDKVKADPVRVDAATTRR